MRARAVCAALAALVIAATMHGVIGGGALERAGDSESKAQARFVNVTAESGLSGIPGNFFAWGDFDRDGHQDLLVDGKRLFRNSGPPDWNFIEVTARAGIGDSGANTGSWADYDNDGYLDIYCPSGGWSTDYSPLWDILWRNRGDGTFENVTEAAGHVTDTFPSVAAAWGDYDRDGFVDIYVANYENSSMSSYYPDVLWRNRGDGTFENATNQAGVDESAAPRPGRGVSWCDFDNDGWLDLYVCNYRLQANYLYRNNRNGTFTNVAENCGVEGEPSSRLGRTYYGHSVGAAWSDIENDGDFDLWVSNLAHKDLYRGPICDDSELYLSAGAGGGYVFENVRSDSGIPTKRIGGGEDELFVGCAWGDFNCDGYEDLFIPQIYDDVPYAFSYLFRNNGNGTFTDVSAEAGVSVWDTYGGCWCDYDEDGDLDLITGGKGVATAGAPHEIHLFKNLLNEEGDTSWLELELVGTRCNAAAIGARVQATVDGMTQMREVQGGMGAHSMQNSMRLHFGFPGRPRSADLSVRWPDGSLQELKGVALNRILRIVQGAGWQPDLSVERLTISPAVPVEGDEVTILVTVKNAGAGAAERYRVSVYRDDVVPSNRLGELEITTPLPSGASVDHPFVWRTEGASGDHTVIAIIGDVRPPESNTGNNRREARVSVLPPGSGRPPVALLTVSAGTVRTGESVLFDGSGSYDPDGRVVAWNFDFGDDSSTGWVVDPLVQHSYSAPGNYTTRLYVLDNSSLVSSNDAHATVRVEPAENRRPVARIVTILPNPAVAGEEISFIGEARDDDGVVVAICWTSDLDGHLSHRLSFSTSSLSTGNHRITLTVMDDSGEWSPPAGAGLEVREPPINKPPRAFIERISPSPALVGEMVTLRGRGEDDDGSVVEYLWSSSLDGSLGSGAILTVNGLRAGSHRISLRVMDDDGAWSGEATARLEVLSYTKEEGANRPPRAFLSVSPPTVQTGRSVRLDGSMSTDPDGRVVEYQFDFGDGSGICWTASAIIEHTYPAPGQYAARLRVRDDAGAISPWSPEVLVTVERPSVAKQLLSPLLPGPGTLTVALAISAAVVFVQRKRRGNTRYALSRGPRTALYGPGRLRAFWHGEGAPPPDTRP
ncbi:MAG: FG-GAP-like repeat-containing protein [Thermoplasmata archaeon]